MKVSKGLGDIVKIGVSGSYRDVGGFFGEIGVWVFKEKWDFWMGEGWG